MHAGKSTKTNQYSVTEYDTIVHKGEMQMPSVMFMYDMSPISVTITETRKSFAHLLVRFCAVVGGVFAVTGTSCSLVSADSELVSIIPLDTPCSSAAVRTEVMSGSDKQELGCLARVPGLGTSGAHVQQACQNAALLTLPCNCRDAGQMGPQAGDSRCQGLTYRTDSSSLHASRSCHQAAVPGGMMGS